MDIDRALNLDELRGRCLVHTRKAYRLLSPLDQPRILDIGCGRGGQTLELARLGGGPVVGIDIDRTALAVLQQRIKQAGLGDRIETILVSLLDNRLVGTIQGSATSSEGAVVYSGSFSANRQ